MLVTLGIAALTVILALVAGVLIVERLARVSHNDSPAPSPAHVAGPPPMPSPPSQPPSSAKKHTSGPAPLSRDTSAPPHAAGPVAPSIRSAVVVIDAGHQAHADLRQEPIGPGSRATDYMVKGGATGVVAPHIPESRINLDIALRLQRTLEARGIRVIMVRTRQNVDVPNSERALIANRAHATLFLRLHCDGTADRSTHGISTLVPGRNHWTSAIASASDKAGRLLQSSVVKATGAADRGVVQRGDLIGFNWSKVPSALVEMGFMSNVAEDRKLDSAAYQQTLANGLADGVERFVASH
jgi:N-acetylmuramoyl-L-alanine amidase